MRVDFYLAQDTRPQADKRVACRLAEKAYKQGLKVYLHTASAADSQQLDGLLWTFRDIAFVPHAIAGAGTDDPAPVIIGHGEPPGDAAGLLVNLSGEMPGFVDRFERVAEIVGVDEDARAQGRARWKQYRDRGHELDSHEV